METSSKLLCEDLVGLVKYVKGHYAALAEKWGLTHMQLYVMNAIEAEGVTMGEVAGNLHCDASNVTGMIDRLVALGMVSRHESEHDRRAKIITLTDKGRQVLDAISDEMPKVLGCDTLKPD